MEEIVEDPEPETPEARVVSEILDYFVLI
jgi:hypothetical protein